MKINVLLTFDYELPLGGFKSYDKGLFEPAEKILAVSKELGVPVVLFADICSAIRFQEWDFDFYKKFKNQIQKAIIDNNDIQLHIHPHWMKSEYKFGTYTPSTKFGLSEFKNDSDFSIEGIIKQAFDSLDKICKEVNPNYKCIAFRAGGYNIEPESKAILQCLYDLGIRIDSSVIQGLYHLHSFSKIDYRNAPDKNHWGISKAGPLMNPIQSDFKEIPITSKPVTVPYLIKRRASKIFHKEIYKSRKYNNTGKGFKEVSGKTNISDKVRMAFNPIPLTFDREHYEVKDLMEIVDYNIRKFSSESEIYITSIAHPKSMGEYHIELMRKFILQLKIKYKKDVNFTTYSSIINSKIS